LVVDDEDLVRWSLKEALSARGHVVTEAPDGHSALGRCPAEVDLALLDYRLPDTDGLELAALVRRTSPGCQVILMTAYGSPELAEQAAQSGLALVVDKPFDVGEMLELVERALTKEMSGSRPTGPAAPRATSSRGRLDPPSD